MPSSPKPKACMILLAELVADERLMRPEGISSSHVDQMRETIREKGTLPRIEVWQVGDKKFITDGHHRKNAHYLEEKKEIACWLRVGTWEDALLAAAAANGEPRGLPRSSEYKEHQVRTALLAAPKSSDRGVAKHCRVSPGLVGRVREKMEREGAVPAVDAVEGRDGRAYVRKRLAELEAKPEPRLSQKSVAPGEALFEFKPFIDLVGTLRREQDKMGKRFPDAKKEREYGEIDGGLVAILSAANRLKKRYEKEDGDGEA